MLILRAASCKGRPPSSPVFAEFDETGGTIGRAATNQLVLPDPEQHISRVHASVAFRNGRYVIIDQGRAIRVQLNGRALGNGVEAPLADGDELGIGDYVLIAEIRSAAAAPASAAGGETGLFGATSPAPSAGKAVDDPLALFGSPAAASAAPDSIASLLAAAPSPSTAAPPPTSSSGPGKPPEDRFAARAASDSAAAGNVIPDDFDPFSDQYAAKPLSGGPAAAGPLGLAAESSGKLPDDLDLGLGSGAPSTAGESIDSLFGLTPGGTSSPDLFGAGQPLGESVSQPNTAAADDPFAALGLRQQESPAPLSDNVSELHGSFLPPAASPEAPLASTKPAKGDMFFSWEPDAEAAQTAPVATVEARPPPLPAAPPAATSAVPVDPLLAMFGGARATSENVADALGLGTSPPAVEAGLKERPPLAPEPARPRVEVGIDFGLPPRPAATPREAPAATVEPGLRSVPAASDDELLQAFLRGLGMADLKLPGGLNPQAMELIGALLREAVQGTLDLLLARAMTKREVQADVTMIAGRGNNPLKFSPDAAIALTYLLVPPSRGFMPPSAAMRDAYDDLRSHTFGIMAGMRAALAGVLARFDPVNLETRLSSKTMLDSLLPMNRRAKLWDLFAERYQDISREAQDDFQTLFGREFLRAYEEQVARLKDGEGKK